MTMTEFEHEEAMKSEASKYRSHIAMYASAEKYLKEEMLSFCSEADIAQDSLKAHVSRL